MEIKNLSILGNTFESRLFALAIAVTNADIHVKIFTNGEDFINNIKTPTMFQSQQNITLSYYFEEELGILPSEIFANTNTTLSLCSVFSGIADDDIILPLSYKQHLIHHLIRYNCYSKNFLKDQDPDTQFRAYMEWAIQHNRPLIDLSPFPEEAYRNDKNANLYFTLKEINPNFDAITTQFVYKVGPQFSAGTMDIENIKVILDEKINELSNIEWITAPITDFQTNFISVEDIQGVNTTKDIKNIISVVTGNNSHSVDLLVNTGVSNEFLDSFIESEDDEPLFVENPVFPFTILKQYEAKIKEEPDVLRQDLIDNGIRIHLTYADKTIIQEYQLEDQPINTTQGFNAELLYDETVDVETIQLSENLQQSHIVNQKYSSNYIFLDLNRLGLNSTMGEEFKSLIAFSKLLTYIVGSASMANSNFYNYLNAMESAWDSFRTEVNCMTYYLMRNNQRVGLEFYNNPPEKYQTRFDSWGSGFPDLEYINYLGETVSGLYQSRRFGENDGKTVSFLRYPFMEYDYAVIGQQKGDITSFLYDFSEQEDLFKDIYYMQKYMYNSFIFYNGATDFATFKNSYLI